MSSIFDNKRAKSVLRALFVLAILLYMWPPAGAGAAEIKVAAAADLTFAFKDVADRFQKQTGNTVRLSYGSSGNFFAQIRKWRAVRSVLFRRCWLSEKARGGGPD